MIALDLERIQALMARHKESQKSLAHKARLHENTMSLLMRGERPPTLATVSKIATALHVSGFTILKETKDNG